MRSSGPWFQHSTRTESRFRSLNTNFDTPKRLLPGATLGSAAIVSPCCSQEDVERLS